MQHALRLNPPHDMLSPRSPRDGDIVLVGEDGLSVRVHEYQLKTYR